MNNNYELHVDASAMGIGAMFRNAEDQTAPPIMYLSATLKGAQQYYSPTELELFEQLNNYFVKRLRPYLLGRKFTINHKPRP